MILVYALGGGLGHLTRVRAALATAAVAPTAGPVTILTSSPYAADVRVTGGFDVVAVPEPLARDRAGLGRFVASTLATVAPSELLIDAFPAGILGELTASMIPASVRVSCLARALRWSRYSLQLPPDPPTLDVAWILEPPEPEHRTYLAAHARAAHPLTLADPAGPARDRAGHRVSLPTDRARPARPTWLIVHSGPGDEVAQLVAYARDQARLEGAHPRFVLISPNPSDLSDSSDSSDLSDLSDQFGHVGVTRIDAYPAGPLMAAADRVFTAGGFNAMRETTAWPERHRALPFERTLDDQSARIRRARPPAPLSLPTSSAHTANR